MQTWTRQVTSSSTFRSRRDWSEPHNLGINFPVIRHFSSSLQNAYSSEKLNGLSYYLNSIFFQLQGGFPCLTPWPGALALDPTVGYAPRLPYRLALRARHVVPHCLEEIAATACKQNTKWEKTQEWKKLTTKGARATGSDQSMHIYYNTVQWNTTYTHC